MHTHLHACTLYVLYHIYTFSIIFIILCYTKVRSTNYIHIKLVIYIIFISYIYFINYRSISYMLHTFVCIHIQHAHKFFLKADFNELIHKTL